jgi:hypothetical protein
VGKILERFLARDCPLDNSFEHQDGADYLCGSSDFDRLENFIVKIAKKHLTSFSEYAILGLP